jgi:alkylation response protein AidB-like acyl-CoA dehydrogenase
MLMTQEQKDVVAAVARVAKERVAPRATEIDATGEYAWDLKELFAELGYFGVGIPKAYGGTGHSLQTVCMVVEELGKVCGSTALMVASQELGAMPIMIAGSEETKKKYLAPLASGEAIAAFCLTEAGAGSDAGAMSTVAVRDGDEWVLNGSKCYITNGSQADIFSVFAKSKPNKGIRGISVFVVERNSPGFKIGRIDNKMGIRGSSTTEIIFEDCRIPAENLMGREGMGFSTAMGTLDRTRPTVAAQGLGIAQGALDHAIAYMKERQQFGHAISNFQGLRWMAAELATEIESARQLIYHAAEVIDKEDEGGKKRLSSEAGRLSAMCKLKATDVAMRVTTDAVQLTGGYGYMKENPLERMMRDAKITQIYEGTNQVQREVIASKLFV